jgi:hypothetical protein
VVADNGADTIIDFTLQPIATAKEAQEEAVLTLGPMRGATRSSRRSRSDLLAVRFAARLASLRQDSIVPYLFAMAPAPQLRDYWPGGTDAHGRDFTVGGACADDISDICSNSDRRGPAARDPADRAVDHHAAAASRAATGSLGCHAAALTDLWGAARHRDPRPRIGGTGSSHASTHDGIVAALLTTSAHAQILAGPSQQPGTLPPARPIIRPPPLVAPPPVPSVVTPLPSPTYGVPAGVIRAPSYGGRRHDSPLLSEET